MLYNYIENTNKTSEYFMFAESHWADTLPVSRSSLI